MKRPRRVFGRVRKEINGKVLSAQMTREGVHLRYLYARKGSFISFHDLAQVVSGQTFLKL